MLTKNRYATIATKEEIADVLGNVFAGSSREEVIQDMSSYLSSIGVDIHDLHDHLDRLQDARKERRKWSLCEMEEPS